MSLRRYAAALAVFAAIGLTGGWVAPASTQGPVEPACTRIDAPGESGIYVNLANDVTPATIQHVRDAVAAGQPRILHWDPDPARTAARRRASLKGHPTAPGMDRDEYPPAASREGGAGADVRLIPLSDNRSSGQRMGAVMRGFCTGQPFIVEP